MTISLDKVQYLVDQLTPHDQLRLIEYLSQQIAPALATQPKEIKISSNTAWAKIEQLRKELAHLPAERLASEQLNNDRAERQAIMEGNNDVYS